MWDCAQWVLTVIELLTIVVVGMFSGGRRGRRGSGGEDWPGDEAGADADSWEGGGAAPDGAAQLGPGWRGGPGAGGPGAGGPGAGGPAGRRVPVTWLAPPLDVGQVPAGCTRKAGRTPVEVAATGQAGQRARCPAGTARRRPVPGRQARVCQGPGQSAAGPAPMARRPAGPTDHSSRRGRASEDAVPGCVSRRYDAGRCTAG